MIRDKIMFLQKPSHTSFLCKSVFLAVMFCFVSLSDAIAANIFEELGATFVANFDKTIVADKPKELQFEKHGGKIIPDGISGGALQLRKGEYLAFDAKTILKSDEGTIAFWVRPHWSYYDNLDGNLVSHTFVSFSRAGSGYFVVSDGWWEPAGSIYTYLVSDSQDRLHASTTHLYRRGEWVHVVCVWKSGVLGYVRLYMNGLLVADRNRSSRPAGVSNKGQLFLGCDKGTSLAQNRWADSDIDELAFFNRVLSAEEIRKVYQKQNPLWRTDDSWMQGVLSMPYSPIKNSKGIILETRAIFDEGTGWMTAKGASEVIRRIKKAGFNVFVPCIWHGAGTRYPSTTVLPETGRRFSGFDPLSNLIKEAHANGIEVHPWFTIALRQREFYREYYDVETPAKSFDIHRKDLRKFITDLVLDVVRRYDIQGINLDYIRAMGVCTCPYCVREYWRQFGRDLLADIKKKDSKGGLEPHLQRWQDEAVEAIVRDVALQSKKIRPNMVLSVDGGPIPSFLSPSLEGRQEVRWANAGLVDVIYNMDYQARPDFERYEIVRRELKTPSSIISLLGNCEKTDTGRVVSRDPESLAKLVSLVQRKYSGSVAVYLYSQLSDSQIEKLHSGPFKLKSRPFGSKNTRRQAEQ